MQAAPDFAGVSSSLSENASFLRKSLVRTCVCSTHVFENVGF